MGNNEYQELQHLRDLWTHAIMTWAQIFIPLGIGIISLIIAQLHTFIESNLGFQFTFLGWLLYSATVAIWRVMARQIDGQIVQLYPRMLELEKEHKMEIQTRYFFNNLRKEAKKKLAKLSEGKDIQTKEWKYEDFRDRAGTAFYDMLLLIWKQCGRKSVNSRGHFVQNISVAISSISFLFVILYLQCYTDFFASKC